MGIDDKKVQELLPLDKDQRRWAISTRDVKNVYGLALVQLEDGATSLGSSDVRPEFRKLLFSNRTLDDATQFNFRVNPRSIGIEEPAAVVIKPTQGGGQFIEHQGQIYKNIRISGTTGLRPNRGTSFSRVDPRTGLAVGERTGFDDLLQLRNLFRRYYALKKDPALASTTVMVWKNGKEAEYYVVEPITFRTDRDASSPLTATYDINLRTIGRLDMALVVAIDDPFSKRRARQRSGLNAVILKLANSVNKAATFADAYATAGLRFVTDILKPTNELLSALTNFSNSGQRFFDIPKNSIYNLSSNITDAARSMSSLASNFTASGFSDRYKDAENILRKMARDVRAIVVSDFLYAPKPMADMTRKSAVYADAVSGIRGSGGDVTDLANQTKSSGTGQAVIGESDNIRKLAKKLLGHSGKWKSLVVLNGLKAPYISKDGDGIDVLRPGDYILYPSNGRTSNPAVALETTGKHRTLSPVEERLGRDIRLSSPTSAGAITLFDFVIGENGDAELVEGIDNMKQAVRIKFETEQGELAMHPYFGIKYPLGRKAPSANNFIEFDVQARATLLSDDRIGDVSSLDISIQGNTLEVKADVVVQGFDGDLSVDFSTKR